MIIIHNSAKNELRNLSYFDTTIFFKRLKKQAKFDKNHTAFIGALCMFTTGRIARISAYRVIVMLILPPIRHQKFFPAAIICALNLLPSS